MADDAPLKFGLPAQAGPDARVLILGSLPGEASLAAEQYYAHRGNQFWRLVGAVVGEDIAALDYAGRLEALRHHGIALWDMVAAGRRQGSLDQALKVTRLQAVADLAQRLPRLRAIAFNGGKSAALGAKVPGLAAWAQLSLPSSSAANTAPFAQKLAAWSAIAPFL